MKNVARELIPPILLKVAKKALGNFHSANNLNNPNLEEQELRRLSSLPRCTRTTANLLGREFQVTDGADFAGMYISNFKHQELRFISSTNQPLIIDCGANVGITVNYWKYLCPNARVVAFEPDPESFLALKANCAGLKEVELKQQAVWKENTTLKFSAVGTVRGHISSLVNRSDNVPEVEVQAVRLRDFLTEPIELLKIDIEGSEIDVLSDCEDRLKYVNKLFVEYHSFVKKPQRLAEFFAILERSGFRIHASQHFTAKQPFIDIPVVNEKDFRLNVYCYRE